MTSTPYAIAATAALLLTANTGGEAKGRDGRVAASATTDEGVRNHRGEPRPPMRDATQGYGGGRIIRDHRDNPQPWALPRHWHRH